MIMSIAASVKETSHLKRFPISEISCRSQKVIENGTIQDDEEDI